jgi:hypothetical protein
LLRWGMFSLMGVSVHNFLSARLTVVKPSAMGPK